MTEVASRFFAYLTVAAGLAVAVLVSLRLLAKVSPAAEVTRRDVQELIRDRGLIVAWGVASVSALGSLFYSEVAGFVPCNLCWYQRTSASCDATAPCTATWVWEFHFISIPLMALTGFALIGALMLWGPGRSTEGRTHERHDQHLQTSALD